MQAIWFVSASHLQSCLEQGAEICLTGYYGMTWDEAADPTFGLLEALERKLPRWWLFAVLDKRNEETVQGFQKSHLWKPCDWRMIFPIDPSLPNVACFQTNNTKLALEWLVRRFNPALMVTGQNRQYRTANTTDWVDMIERVQHPVLGSYTLNILKQYGLQGVPVKSQQQ